MIVAGVMSGTSADGINVAIVRFSPTRSKRGRTSRGTEYPSPTLLGHEEIPFPAGVRREILGMMNAELARVADLARLNFLLGELYAEAVAKATRKHRLKIDLVGCHGQTLYHQGTADLYLKRKLAVTWQTGEAAVIAQRLGVPVVSDFRPADMAAGGRGAPLVPLLDFLLYRDERVNQIAQNIGGIGNLTAIPAGGSAGDVVAFDTGPGNMVIDAAMQELFARPYDRDGKVADAGQPLEGVIAGLMGAPFFRQKPPRTAGREEFGREYALRFLQLCGNASQRDVIATATALTARTIADGVRRFVLPRFATSRKAMPPNMIVSGGGAKNPVLIRMLREEIGALGISLHFSDEFGVPAEAKEAVAFALLAYQTWNRQPGNIPSATGAKRAVILGKISYV